METKEGEFDVTLFLVLKVEEEAMDQGRSRQLLEAGKRINRFSPKALQKEHSPADSLIFKTSDLQN